MFKNTRYRGALHYQSFDAIWLPSQFGFEVMHELQLFVIVGCCGPPHAFGADSKSDEVRLSCSHVYEQKPLAHQTCHLGSLLGDDSGSFAQINCSENCAHK